MINRGFTLLEVLVAGTILFMVIASVTLVYRSAALNSRKAEQALAMSGYLPILLDNLSISLRELDHGNADLYHGNGQFAGVSYEWRAKLIQRKAPMPRLDPLSGEPVAQAERYRLWSVELTLQYLNGSKTYQFEELTYPEIK